MTAIRRAADRAGTLLHLRHHVTLLGHEDASELQVRLRVVPGAMPGQEVRRASLACSANPRVATHEERGGARVDSFGVRHGGGEVEVLVEADVRADEPPVVTPIEAVELTQRRGLDDDASELDRAIDALRAQGVPARVLLAHRGDGQVRTSAELFLERAVDGTWHAETLSGDTVSAPLIRIATGWTTPDVTPIRLVQHAPEPPEVKSVASAIELA